MTEQKKNVFIGVTLFVLLPILFLFFSWMPISDNIDSNKEVQTFSHTQIINKNLTYNLAKNEIHKHKGDFIEWGGRIFTEPEYDSERVYLQLFYKDINDNSFIVVYNNPHFKVSAGDYVIVKGWVAGIYEGQNPLGGIVSGINVVADSIEITTRAKVVAPSEITLTVDQTKAQYGFSVSVEKIEIAKEETRFYLKVKNSRQDTVNFYTYGAKLVQDNKQIETKYMFDNKEELPNEFLPNVEMNGVLVFPPIDIVAGNLKLYLDDPYATGAHIDFQEFIFDINLSKSSVN